MDTISKETDIDKIRIYYSQNIQLDHRKDKLNYTHLPNVIIP
ncbi:hypothetical protein SAMN05216253_12739 [Bacteroides thetaiotaomicron]|nr:hypothetical protein SAMN05216253_12739 [Bacteroides thetaiotaomicron]